jgi:hypothetical protein
MKRTPKLPKSAWPVSPPPQQTITACPDCGAGLLIAVYKDGMRHELPEPVTALLGVSHACAQRRAA